MRSEGPRIVGFTASEPFGFFPDGLHAEHGGFDLCIGVVKPQIPPSYISLYVLLMTNPRAWPKDRGPFGLGRRKRPFHVFQPGSLLLALVSCFREDGSLGFKHRPYGVSPSSPAMALAALPLCHQSGRLSVLAQMPRMAMMRPMTDPMAAFLRTQRFWSATQIKASVSASGCQSCRLSCWWLPFKKCDAWGWNNRCWVVRGTPRPVLLTMFFPKPFHGIYPHRTPWSMPFCRTSVCSDCFVAGSAG